MNSGCPFCEGDGGEVLHRDDLLRVVLVDEPEFPGFARVILHGHVREMSDLPDEARQRLLVAVFAVEAAQREVLAPHKVNLASLGNQVPHLHWHVIGRFADDSRWPDPVWAPARRPGAHRHPPDDAALGTALARLLA